MNENAQYYTVGFGLVLLGGLLIVSGLRNRSIEEVIQGITSPKAEQAPALAFEGKLPTGTSAGTQPWEHNQRQVAETIYKEATAAGLTPVAAAGLIGNAVAESSLNPAAVGDQGTSFGLWQFHASLGHLGMGPVPVQVHNMINYLRSNPGVLNSIQHASSAAEAARIIEEQVERPASIEQSRALRESEAERAYREFAR
jgi:hypothetical protein